jgi:hypothetical protein
MQSTFYSCSIEIKLEFSRQILEKNTQILKSYENLSGGNSMRTNRQEGPTDLAQLIATFRNLGESA